MKTLYHCTKAKHLQEILIKGLVPNKPDVIKGAIKGVYLSEKPFDWMHYATKETTEAGLMIAVDVVGLELIVDTGLIDADTYEEHPAFIYNDIIPVTRFKRISVSTDNKPWSFEDISEQILRNENEDNNKTN